MVSFWIRGGWDGARDRIGGGTWNQGDGDHEAGVYATLPARSVGNEALT